jgi:hypothetical protein
MDSPTVSEPRQAPPSWAQAKITPKQRAFLLNLVAEKAVKPSQEGNLDQIVKCLRISEDPEEFGMSKGKAAELIEWFVKQPNKPSKPEAAIAPLPDGYYALRDVPGHKNEITFYRLNTAKSTSRWAGRQFLDQIVGGNRRYPVRSFAANQTRALIHEQGINEARALFGQELGRCGVCGLPLTDDESRRLGIGPVCRNK